MKNFMMILRKIAPALVLLCASPAAAETSKSNGKSPKVSICLQKGPKEPISCSRYSGVIAPQIKEACESSEGVDSKKNGNSSKWIEGGVCPKGAVFGSCTTAKGTSSVTYYNNSDVKRFVKFDVSAAKSACSSMAGTWSNGG